MSDFKVAFRADAESDSATAPGWEAGCPLLIDAVQVSRNTSTGAAFLQIKLTNITDKVVGSFRLSAHAEYEDGTGEDFKISVLDADIPAGSTNALSPSLCAKAM